VRSAGKRGGRPFFNWYGEHCFYSQFWGNSHFKNMIYIHIYWNPTTIEHSSTKMIYSKKVILQYVKKQYFTCPNFSNVEKDLVPSAASTIPSTLFAFSPCIRTVNSLVVG
jgi:hypothetical protein